MKIFVKRGTYLWYQILEYYLTGAEILQLLTYPATLSLDNLWDNLQKTNDI